MLLTLCHHNKQARPCFVLFCASFFAHRHHYLCVTWQCQWQREKKSLMMCIVKGSDLYNPLSIFICMQIKLSQTCMSRAKSVFRASRWIIKITKIHFLSVIFNQSWNGMDRQLCFGPNDRSTFVFNGGIWFAHNSFNCGQIHRPTQTYLYKR